MYTCGLDISEKVIHGCCLEGPSAHTVRQFCVPRDAEQLANELSKLTRGLNIQPKYLRLVAADYSNHLDELLGPLWKKGYARPLNCRSNGEVDRLLLRAYRCQRAWWDRAHLMAYILIEEDQLRTAFGGTFCRRWNLHRLREKLEQIEPMQRARRPDWLQESSQALIRPREVPF